MAAGTLNEQAVGTIVKIKENDAWVNFIVLQHGYPTAGNGRTLVIREGIHSNRRWDESSHSYVDSDIDIWLTGTYLNTIDATIKSQITAVDIKSHTGAYPGKWNYVTRKVFLLAYTEVGFEVPDEYTKSEGTAIPYFNSNTRRIANLNGKAAIWWLRTARATYSNLYDYVWYVTAAGTAKNSDVGSSASVYGIRPAFTLPGTLWVNEDGTVSVNTPPSAPASITVPSSVQGGAAFTITWEASTDPDGNLAGYKLERTLNSGGTWTQVYQSTAATTQDTIPFGTADSVQYRVKAYDQAGGESGWTMSQTAAVINNTAPVITSESSSDLGLKDEDFSFTYTVSDAQVDTVTVTEALDGTVTKTYTPTLDQENTYSLTGVDFQKTLNGDHTITITAKDAGNMSGSLTRTFTKGVYALSITLKTPISVETPITKMVMNITRSIPADAGFQVLVTNNANDTAPVWEDATVSVIAGQNYIFTNETATETPGFNFKITAQRGDSDMGGWISSIGGAFE